MEQVINQIVEKEPKVGLLEKLFCRGNEALPHAESSIHWQVANFAGADAVAGHVAGDAVPSNSRAASYGFSVATPYYAAKRALSADDIMARISATAGLPQEQAIAHILGNDIRQLTRDLVTSVERQAAKLATACQVDYKLTSGSFTAVNCYALSNPCTHSQTTKIDVDALGAVDELVEECLVTRGFHPDFLILGQTAAADLLADANFQALGKNNNWNPELISLTPDDGGSFLGFVNSKFGAKIEIYALNESSMEGTPATRTPLLTAKGAIMGRSGCFQSVVGSVPVPNGDSGTWSQQRGRIVVSYNRGEIDSTLIAQSRVLVLPATYEWTYASAATT